MFNFEKLEAWHKAIALADVIYRHTRNFPAEERFGLTNQMPRSIISESSNIAEGSSKSSKTDFGRFVEIGTGSVFADPIIRAYGQLVSHVEMDGEKLIECQRKTHRRGSIAGLIAWLSKKDSGAIGSNRRFEPPASRMITARC
jgi:hypothetical protein